MRRRVLTIASAISLVLCIFLIGVALFNAAAGSIYKNSRATNIIAQNGAATSKPSPIYVRVFVPETGGGEKQFGDRQLLAILPVLPQVDGFNELDLHGSAVTDDAVAKLKMLTQLEKLDVSNTPVTVKGLLQLKALPRLNEITIGIAQLSPQDRKQLRAKLPKLIETFRKENGAVVNLPRK